jgi:glycerate kinase
VIESASVIGLTKLPPGKFHPFELDTFGLGAVIRAAVSRGARRCIVGIGGSATNDGGFGMARALGWKFCDGDGLAIERWTELHRLTRISAPRRRRWFKELIVAVDVQNPLLGVRGAARVYGPQKGLRPEDFVVAERNLSRLLIQQHSKIIATKPGAGAAGGLGFGLMTFLGARAEPGFDLFARFAKLNETLRAVDLVITGEGLIDESTFMGKGVGEIARRCRRGKIPCIAFAGKIVARTPANGFFAEAYSLVERTTVEKANSQPAIWLERLVRQTAAHF